MIHASKAWLQNTLPSQFQPFVDRWRDNTSPPAQQFTQWLINGEHMGYLDSSHLPTLEKVFNAAELACTVSPLGIECSNNTGPQVLSAKLATAGNMLKALGLVPGWRNEEQLLMTQQGQVLATAERALFKTLGLRSRAVHVHVENHKGCVWTGVRAMTKHENPGMLDNLAAGGIASAESIDSTLWRELDEEAGLNADDFAWIKPLTPHELVLSRPLLYGGWHQETVILFHGQLKPGRRPTNRDGEVGAFQLMTRRASIDAINAWQFTPDAALCCALALATAK
jgi:8-oxo-dGTP pyrophosphatase MutT (NUDIX family)